MSRAESRDIISHSSPEFEPVSAKSIWLLSRLSPLSSPQLCQKPVFCKPQHALVKAQGQRHGAASPGLILAWKQQVPAQRHGGGDVPLKSFSNSVRIQSKPLRSTKVLTPCFVASAQPASPNARKRVG